MIAKKAPKSQHYSGSESLSYRVSAAVGQKNEGHQYILQVNSACNLSPGKQTQVRTKKLDGKRMKQYKRQRTKEGKRKRLMAKQLRHSTQAISELREGVTYESNVDFSKTIEEEDLVEIPVGNTKTAKTQPNLNQPQNIIVFDLETTGFSYSSDIIQIAAKTLDEVDVFTRYVQPANGYIPPAISRLTGIEMHGLQMYSNLLPVKSSSLKSALTDLTAWLQKHPVAHNASFDARFLADAYAKADMTGTFETSSIVGFVDSVKILKNVHPGRSSYKLGDLARDIVPDVPFLAHTALSDVEMVICLIKPIPQLSKIVIKQVTTKEDVLLNCKKLANKRQFIKSYDTLISKKLISKASSNTLASGGVSVEHLRIAHKRGGREGVYSVLKGKISKAEAVALSLDSLFKS